METEAMKPRNPKRRRKKEAAVNSKGGSSRRFNGTILGNSKPSYCLKRGVGTCLNSRAVSFSVAYTSRLTRLLKHLILRHNWTHATAVLTVLLLATATDKSATRNRLKYWAVMEILKQMKGDNIKFLERIQRVYDLWILKSRKKVRRKSVKVAIQLEYILFCLTHGGLRDAHQIAKGFIHDRDFKSDPISNFVVGLTSYEMWYYNLEEKWQLKNLNYTDGSMQSEVHEARANSEYDAVESREINFSMEANSVTSVANDKERTDLDSSQERVSMDGVDNLQTQSPPQAVSHAGSYVYSAEGSEDIRSSSPTDDGVLSVSIFQAPGLPPWLLPLKIPPTYDLQNDVIYEHRELQNDCYINAVEHLRVALHSTPPVAEALHPLIQVLLSGDQVNEALHELEIFFDDSATALKLRLKVGLLEHFDRGNHLQLSSCYEEILEIDPTCNNSLVKLINMNQRGDYGTEKLVKMLGLFLDATYAKFEIWKCLASSLIKLSQCAGDQMSMCSNGNGEESNPSYTGHTNQIPELFTHGQSGRTWRFRCRWWLTRHFSSRILASEIASGEFQLLTYKAAVAAFLYGPGFKYVTKATEILENDSTNHHLNSVLRIHVQNYVGIYKV